MSTVKKTLKALLKTVRHPVQQANDELEGKKFWTKDVIASKKKNEEVELDEGTFTEDDIALGGTVIYKKDGKHHISKAAQKTPQKVITQSGHDVPMHHVVSTDFSDWKKYNQNESVELDEIFADSGSGYAAMSRHRVAVTVSDPHHQSVSQRKEKIQKIIRVSAENNDDAKDRAENHYLNKGYKVHDVEHIEQINKRNESVELDEAAASKNELYKKAAKLAAAMTTYANSLKKNDPKASAAHLKAVDAQFAAYQAGLEIGHKDMLKHLSTGSDHLDKTGQHDLNEDSTASGEIAKHVNAVHALMKAHHAAIDKHEGTTTSRSDVLNSTNRALKTAHGPSAPQISRLRSDEDKPANITAGKLSNHSPVHVIVRHLGRASSSAAQESTHSNNQITTNEVNMSTLTPVQIKIRQIVENFTSRESVELDEARGDMTHHTEYDTWRKHAETLNSKKHDDNADVTHSAKGSSYAVDGNKYAMWDKTTNTGYVNESTELDEAATGVVHTINITRRGNTRQDSGTLRELIDKHKYTLETGKSYEHEKGNKKINLNPKNIHDLVTHLYNAKSNAARDGNPDTNYTHHSSTNESVELDEVSDKLKGSPWDPAYKVQTKPSRTITKFKSPSARGAEITQVRHADDADDVYDEDGNLIDKDDATKEKRGRGRPAGAKSGARTHGSEGGVKNQAVYGGQQFSMPSFGNK